MDADLTASERYAIALSIARFLAWCFPRPGSFAEALGWAGLEMFGAYIEHRDILRGR